MRGVVKLGGGSRSIRGRTRIVTTDVFPIFIGHGSATKCGITTVIRLPKKKNKQVHDVLPPPQATISHESQNWMIHNNDNDHLFSQFSVHGLGPVPVWRKEASSVQK